MKPAHPALLCVLMLALAGCGKPPSGTVTSEGAAITVEGVANVDYEAGTNPYNTTAPTGPTGCGLPAPAPQCTPPSTTIHVRLDQAPAPGTAYDAVLTGASPDMKLGELKPNGTTYELTWASPSDLAGKYSFVDVRIGSFVLAHAAAQKAPSNKFVVVDQDLKTTVSGTFSGPDLSVTVAGLPGNGTFLGALYQDVGGNMTQEATFPVPGNGPLSYHASQNIGAFKELHIHVAGTMVVLAKAALQ
ncbi:MAG: hypothetical protein ACYDBQ_04365 [Thermoplasmatota archaeon]